MLGWSNRLYPRRRGIVSSRRPFNPKQVFGTALKGWWQTDNVANTVSNGFFTSLKDLSGLGFDLTQGNADNQPPTATAAIAGKQCVEFDGGAHIYYLSTSSSSAPGLDSPFYLFGIIKPRLSATLSVNRAWFGGIGTGVLQYRDDGVPVTNLQIYAGGAGGESAAVVNGSVYAVTAQFNDSSSFIRLNREAKAASGTEIGTNGIGQAIIGTNGGFGANDCADGYLLECGIVSGLVSNAQDDACNKYLLSRAGL